MNQELANYKYLREYAKPLKTPERKMLGREDEVAALQAVLMRPELSNVILLADAGSGKALADDTLIPVADERGYVPIGEIKVGDTVFDEAGEPTKVMGVYHQGEIDAYEVTFADGTKVICNEEHIWHVRNHLEHLGDRLFRDLTLAEIIEKSIRKDVNSKDNKVAKRNWYIPVAKPVQRDEMEFELDPYEFGALLCSKDSSEKVGPTCIPKEYFLGSIDQRFLLLQGLMDTSGSISSDGSGKCTFYNDSADLVDDVKSLVTSLGMRASIGTNKENDSAGEYKLTIICEPEQKENLFKLSENKNIAKKFAKNYKKRERFDDVAITSVVQLNRKVSMTCIFVDSPKHLYLCTENHIVTHNTALVQKCMVDDPIGRIYLEVDVSKLASGNINDMPARVKGLFDEVYQFRQDKNTSKEIVLFMDEFHQIVQLSDAAVEAIKPCLADSASRGIKVIAATTFDEFKMYVQSNQPLVERLYRLNLKPLSKEIVVQILRGMAETYGVGDKFYDDSLFEQIYEYTELYIPASSQPRKSILMLDAMIGYHRAHNAPLNLDLLATIVNESQGVNVAFKVDATSIKKKLDKKVFSQELATELVARRLHVAVADLHDTSRPMSSFLLTGSSGVGKTELTKALSGILFEDHRSLLRFDMTEYSNEESLERFREEITSRVWQRPFSIVLLDEIEKAAPEIIRLLLQVLDDARLMDRNNREVSFKNCYIVMTTNAASEVYKEIAAFLDEDEAEKDAYKITATRNKFSRYRKLIRRALIETGDNQFPPELYNRIDEVIPFAPLNNETLEKITITKLNELAETIQKKHGVYISFSHLVPLYLLYEDADVGTDAGGARGVVRKLTSDVTSEIAKAINEHPDIKYLHVDVRGDMVYQNKAMRESQAYIVPLNSNESYYYKAKDEFKKFYDARLGWDF